VTGAITLAAEIGDFRRFANPKQLMAWLGLVPREHSSGASTSRGAITKAGNGRARRLLRERLDLPPSGADRPRAPGAQVPLSPSRSERSPGRRRSASVPRYRRLHRTGKPTNVVAVAIARELAAFAWAIAITVTPMPSAA
jgi:hypothetical protein